MRFSKLEQELIIEIGNWAKKPHTFRAFRLFMSDYGLPTGTGLIAFSKGAHNKHKTLLCIDIDENKIDTNYKAYEEDIYTVINNRILFLLHFVLKLEKLGLITLVHGPYKEDEEYGIACFANDIRATPIKPSKTPKTYTFKFYYPEIINVKFGDEHPDFIDSNSGIALNFHNAEFFSRIDAFDIISSLISIEQDLFDLKERNFLTAEELMLIKADEQIIEARIQSYKSLKKAEEQLSEARKQAEESLKKADEQLSEARKQAEESLKKADEQLSEARKQTKWSLCAVVLSILAIIISLLTPRCTSKTTLDKIQMSSFQENQNRVINEINDIQEELGTVNNNQEKLISQLDSILSSINKNRKNNSKNTKK